VSGRPSDRASRARSAPFERLAVLGLGLLGGSLALAARERGLALRVVGAGRRPAPLARALAEGVVDETGSVEEAVVGADLVVLATPVSSMQGVLQRVAPHLRSGAIVTDVGSVKGLLADTLPGLLPEGVEYIGSHPMAGSHERGVEYADATLFEDACCVVTPLSGADPGSVERLSGFWEALGSRVVERDPMSHDQHAAWVSHAPHLLAFAFAHAMGEAPHRAGEMAGGGFRDFTRIGRSDSELWGDILGANRKALSAPLQAFRHSLEAIASAVEEGDRETLERLLAEARETLFGVGGPTEENGEGE
jgi:prephenate dehydrogenase